MLIVLLLSSAATVVGTVHAAPGGAPVEAAFRVRSAAPGETAVLDVWTPVHDLRVEIVRVGPGGSHEPLGGQRVARIAAGAARTVRVEVGRWRSGVYAASLRDGRRHGWAVLVVRPRRLGAHRVAVVLPTNTWHAYNRRDVDGDGTGDTWYETPTINRVDLRRPFLDGGVPPHFRAYDRGFLHWLADRQHGVDYLADDDFERIAHGDRLAKLYDLVVFPGHEEYATTHAYDVLRALPRSRRQPRVPIGEQHLLSGGAPRTVARPRGPLARPRSPGGRARRRRVPTLEREPLRECAVRRHGRAARSLVLAERVSRTAIASDRSESRSTRARATRRPGCASSPESPMPSAPGDRRR